MLELTIGLLIGALFGAVSVVILARDHVKRVNTRWKLASEILNKADVDRILGHKLLIQDTKSDFENPSEGEKEGSKISQIRLRQMPSWDRAELEIQRAKNKLPPRDNLVGMESWDIVSVEKARMKYGTVIRKAEVSQNG